MILQKTNNYSPDKLNSIKQLSDYKDLVLQYAPIENEYRYALREMSAKLENLDDYCQMRFAHNPIHHIESRIKTLDSIIEKIERRGYEPTLDNLRTYIYDIAGIRVVCKYINDIYQIVDLLSKQKDLEIMIKKDYIVHPKDTGYRSLHIVFIIEIYVDDEIKKVPVEIQFRTLAMDMWACLEHELRYKSHNQLSITQQNELKEYSSTLYNVDLNMQKIYISTIVGDDDND